MNIVAGIDLGARGLKALLYGSATSCIAVLPSCPFGVVSKEDRIREQKACPADKVSKAIFVKLSVEPHHRFQAAGSSAQ